MNRAGGSIVAAAGSGAGGGGVGGDGSSVGGSSGDGWEGGDGGGSKARGAEVTEAEIASLRRQMKAATQVSLMMLQCSDCAKVVLSPKRAVVSARVETL